jgi:hypothetical protein
MTTAAAIQSKIKAGLTLCGQDYYGILEWVGAGHQWKAAERNEEWLLEHGRLPHDSRGYREVEPEVFIKR